jgi:hypothetical protein
MLRSALSGLLLLLSVTAIGCGSSRCKVTAISITPSTATIDHSSPAPGNQQAFNAFTNNNGCAAPGVFLVVRYTDAVWSSSDPTDAPISNMAGATYGVATCLNAINGPVTITATRTSSGQTLVGKATLMCN